MKAKHGRRKASSGMRKGKKVGATKVKVKPAKQPKMRTQRNFMVQASAPIPPAAAAAIAESSRMEQNADRVLVVKAAVGRAVCPVCNRSEKLIKSGAIGKHVGADRRTECAGIGVMPS